MSLKVLLCVVLALGGVSGCNGVEAKPEPTASAEPGKPSARNATRVEVAVIQPSQAALTMTLPGEIEAWRDAQLAAPMGGYVESVRVESGEKVRKGAILVLVDTATHVARRNQTKVELDTAKVELERAKKLGRTLPGAQLDAAKARHDAAKAAYAAADVQVSRSIITAPFEGVAVSVDIEKGEVAAPGVPLVRVVRLHPVKVTVSLSDRDVLSIHKGMKTRVSTDARGNVREGVIKHIQPAADLKTRSFTAEIEVANEDEQLLPGMIASVQVAAESAASQIIISQDWLVTKPDSLGVFLFDNGKAVWREVKVGPIVRNSAVIESGVKAGDELVTSGHRELAPGDALIIGRRGQCCTNGRIVYEQPAAAKE